MAAIAEGRDPDAGRSKQEPFEEIHKAFLERYFGSRAVRHKFTDAQRKKRAAAAARRTPEPSPTPPPTPTPTPVALVRTRSSQPKSKPKPKARPTPSPVSTPAPPPAILSGFGSRATKAPRKELLKKPLPKRGGRAQPETVGPTSGEEKDDHTERMLRVGHEKIRLAAVEQVSWKETGGRGESKQLEAVWRVGPASQFRDTRSAYYTPRFKWNGVAWRVAFYQNSPGQLGVWLVQDAKGVSVEWEVQLLQQGRGKPHVDKRRNSTFSGELSGKGIFAPNCGTRAFISLPALFEAKHTFVVEDKVTCRLTMKMDS